MSSKLLILVAGPTASGKTGLAVHIAEHFQTEIISADSRQFFAGIPIGTAQPDAADLLKVPHHFIGTFGLEEQISAGRYADIARQKLDELFTRHQVVVMCGGSGLYLDAVLNGVDNFPEADPAIRESLNKIYHHEGIEGLQRMLQEKDPEQYARVDLRNPRRLVRALEVCLVSGRPYSDFLGKSAAPLDVPVLMTAIRWPREQLYERINLRVDEMFRQGLLQEAEQVFDKRHLNSLHTVGFTELFAYMEGRLTLDEARELIRKNTRNYAKRQMTWFKRYENMIWLDPDHQDVIFDRIRERLAL